MWIPANPSAATTPSSPDDETSGGSRPSPWGTTECPALTPCNTRVDFSAAAAVADLRSDKGYSSKVLEPTSQLVARQWVYLLVMQALGSLLIAGTLNFIVGWCLYPTHSDPPPTPRVIPFLFSPPVSFLVDAAFTTLIQSLITWFCIAFFVNRALSNGHIPPYLPRGRRQPRRGCAAVRRLFSREPSNAVLRWFLYLDHYNSKRGSRVFCGLGRRGVFKWVLWTLAGLGRGVIVAVVAFAVMVGPTIGILVAVGTRYNGDWVFLGPYDAVAFKTVYGGVLGMWMAPVLTFMWMLRAGWIVRRHESLPS